MIDANKHIENKTKNAQTNLDAFSEKKKKKTPIWMLEKTHNDILTQ